MKSCFSKSSRSFTQSNRNISRAHMKERKSMSFCQRTKQRFYLTLVRDTFLSVITLNPIK